MDEQLNHAPAGFLSLTEEGIISSVNQTLLNVTGYNYEQVIGQHINTILSVPARMFYQLYFIPMIRADKKVEEMYISLSSNNGKEVPVLFNALSQTRNENLVIDCILIPIEKRNEYENELLIARKNAESALAARDKANLELENTLQKLKEEQAKQLKLNEQNKAYKTETEKELQLARKIQETLLPEPVQEENIQIEVYYKASRELSGDIYGIYQISPHQYGIILLDVMGHGISSALVTMSLHSLFQRVILTEGNPEAVMEELDNHLHRLFQNHDKAWHYCTAIYLVIDTDTQRIDYINAGHPSAVWLEPDGELHQLSSVIPPLGIFEGMSFHSRSFKYKKGGRILLFTDGVSDSLEIKELHSLLKDNMTASLSSIKNKIGFALKNEKKSDATEDDQCFILVDLT